MFKLRGGNHAHLHSLLTALHYSPERAGRLLIAYEIFKAIKLGETRCKWLIVNGQLRVLIFRFPNHRIQKHWQLSVMN